MGDVIMISFSVDLPTRNQNLLRARMEFKAWSDRRDDAMMRDDYETLDRLDREYEMIGLP